MAPARLLSVASLISGCTFVSGWRCRLASGVSATAACSRGWAAACFLVRAEDLRNPAAPGAAVGASALALAASSRSTPLRLRPAASLALNFVVAFLGLRRLGRSNPLGRLFPASGSAGDACRQLLPARIARSAPASAPGSASACASVSSASGAHNAGSGTGVRLPLNSWRWTSGSSRFSSGWQRRSRAARSTASSGVGSTPAGLAARGSANGSAPAILGNGFARQNDRGVVLPAEQNSPAHAVHVRAHARGHEPRSRSRSPRRPRPPRSPRSRSRPRP